MKLLRRRPKLPAAARPALQPDERVLAWAYVGAEPGGPVAVATNRGLWLPDRARTGWHEIHKAAWSGRELRITPAEVAEQRDGYTVLVDGPVVTYLLLEPWELPDQVRARVTRSVAYTEHHQLPAGGVRVVGRRISGVDGLSWAVRYDSGTPVDAESVVQLTGELVEAAQEATAPLP
ncbi:hypothetical protein [Krasilnikovia sp. MM14-A1259]|uniref:hypothetical protein n=1 Tax=Krasilnikovia sp. MM14-A1259 TaxID=3373539 RepID=UPI0038049C9D